MSRTEIKLQTLTPLHIGSGRAYQPNFEYLFFQSERILALIDEGKVFDIIGASQLHQWVSLIEKKEDLLSFLKTKKQGVAPEDVAKRLVRVIGKGPLASEVKEQLHLGAPLKPCIPGSSIKGSFRTSVLNELINEEPKFVLNYEHLKAGRRKQFKDDQVIAHYFGKKEKLFKGELRLDANKDFMRLVRISDFYLDAQTECHQLEIINEHRDGWGKKNRETSYLECIPANSEGTGTFQIPEHLLGRIMNGNYHKTEYIKKNQPYLNLTALFRLTNKLTKRLVDEEIRFWEEEDNPVVIGQYLDVLQHIRSQLGQLSDEECILRVGAASGWAFMTGAWPRREDLLDDRTWENLRKHIQRRYYPSFVPAPKTRKLLAGGMPLGFVKLTLRKTENNA